jgi:integrase/recombinase XerD
LDRRVQTVGYAVQVLVEEIGICVERHRRFGVFYMRVIGVPPAIGRDGRGFSWREVVVFVPCLIRHQRGAELAAITLGHPLLDEYLAFVAARARINTWLAVASDLKIFFGVVAKEPTEVTAADVFAFLAEQRKPRLGDRVVRLEDGEAGLAARTIARRLSSVRGLYAYLTARGDTGVTRNPVPTSLAARRRGTRRGNGGVPLIRTPRTLPRVLSPAAVDALVGALRTHRDRAMVDAMVLGGLRRCEVLGLRLEDVNAGQRRLFVAEGKGGRQRIVPVSARFFASLGSYLEQERPAAARTERVFVVLKGHRRGAPLSAAGVDEILDGARARAGLQWATCHQLRHTCFTRLREAGMALEAIQAQAGHASIESTRIYLHLADDWLAKEYLRAAEAIEAQAAASVEGNVR